jgi:hypothetical protein
MPEIAVQPAFNGGEWSPNLYARVDIAKYRSATALLENFFVDYRGGASTRPGSAYVIRVYDNASPTRIINFQASFNVGYAVEIGDGYMRFIYHGAPVLETAFNITAATQANPCVITVPGHDFIVDDWIFISGVVGMTQLNGRYFQVQAVVGDDVTLGSLEGVNINSLAYSAYVSGGTAAKVYTISSPYTSADDLRLIKFAQSTNQMILCHPNHDVYVLTLIAADNWTLVAATFGAGVSAPGAPTITTTLAAGSVYYAYVVTAFDTAGAESNASTPGTLSAVQDIRSVAGSNTVSWSTVSGANGYFIYKASVSYGAAVPSDVQFGYVGTAYGNDFVDSNISADFTYTPPIANNPFATVNPTAPGFAQQRLVLAAPEEAPATFYMSKPGLYFNFDYQDPIVPSDSITATLVSGVQNTIKSIVGSAAGMLLLTDQAVWLVNGGSAGSAITAVSSVANPQSYIGASDVPPLVINYDIVFVQSKGSAIRSLSYNVYYNIFTGNDVSVMSSHLFFNYTILEWCWAEQPFYTAQAVRNDGVILSMTYMKEQEFVGWSHYVTNGTYESICSVTEELSSGVAVDAVYTIVTRTVEGVDIQYIERFAQRTFPNGYVSAWCVDSGLQYTGAPATTFTGAEHLAGLTVTGLADGEIITPFVMPLTGFFTLATAASTVTIGLAYTCKLQTLPLEVGEPSIQGDVKKITQVNIRVAETLGLSIGSSFSSLTAMKDLVLGAVSSQLTGMPSQIITDLVTGDAVTILDPTYTVLGQFCIQQSQPYPATVLGVFPVFSMENRNER